MDKYKIRLAEKILPKITCSSSHGDINDSSSFIIEVEGETKNLTTNPFSRGVNHFLINLVQYEPEEADEPEYAEQEDKFKKTWQVTDLQVLEISASYTPIFKFTAVDCCELRELILLELLKQGVLKNEE